MIGTLSISQNAPASFGTKSTRTSVSRRLNRLAACQAMISWVSLGVPGVVNGPVVEATDRRLVRSLSSGKRGSGSESRSSMMTRSLLALHAGIRVIESYPGSVAL